MKSISKGLLTSAIIAGLGVPAVSHATNGYFLIGFGAKSRAMGGVGVAEGQDGLAAAFNPAVMADVETRFDVGVDLFVPQRGAFIDSNELPADQTSRDEFYPIPNMGMVYKYDDQISYGVAVVGAGMGTTYDQSAPACSDGDPSTVDNNFFNFSCNASNRMGVLLMQMQILPSISYKLDDTHTVGATLVAAVQQFRAYGFGAFEALGFTTNTNGLTNNGPDWSYGAGIRLGWQGKFLNDTLKIGVNYSSRVYMSEFDKYDGLFAEHGDFDIPENYAIGFAYKPTDDISLYFDVQQINYSEVASVGNPGPQQTGGFFPCGDVTCGALGNDQGLGFGWTDQTVYKLGGQYIYDPTWTFRAGLNYGETPIPKDQVLFATVAPATVEFHYTLGLTYKLDKESELNFSYVHAFEKTLTGYGPYSARQPGEDNIAISMVQDSLGISYGLKF